ncbi:hypothetical protein JCM3765_004004 [Sporobolomyces pararoseus]
MSSRRIPISSTQRSSNSNSNSNNQNNNQNQTTPFRSSLDLVFSFSRSAGFFGENLPSGPSFVDEERYRPPGYNDDTETEEEGIEGEGEEEDEEEDEEGEGGHERGPSDQQYLVDLGSSQEVTGGGETTTTSYSGAAGLVGEQLPRNAKRQQRQQLLQQQQQQPPKSILSASPPVTESPISSSPPVSTPHATFTSQDSPSLQAQSERTPLLPVSPDVPTRSRGRRRSSQGGNRKPSYGTLQQDPDSLESGVEGGSQKRKRRASTFSKEAWKAAIEEHRGESTWFQSLFNTVNVLVGVGLLAEPLAFAYGGWLLGTLLLLFCALVTNYTAKMLASLMRLDPTQHTYADVLIKAFGPKSRKWIYALFVIELGTFSVAAIELFADSLNSLFPKISSTFFKLISYFIIVPTTFLPLRLLSLTSLLGILSSIVLLSVIIADGTIKTTAPGSLWQPMKTSWDPDWKKLPICFGLMMSGFSGHAVVPSLYRDMKNPQHFSSMINVAYVIAFTVSIVFAILGYCMFGNSVSSEITKDLSRTQGYPVALTKVAVWMVAINPIVKYAVANKPLVTTFEHLIGLHPLPPPPAAERPPLTSAISTTSSDSGFLNPNTSTFSSHSHGRTSLRPSQSNLSLASSMNPIKAKQRRIQLIRYWFLRPILSVLFVLIAVAIPDFDRVLSFLGSSSAFVICCVGPIGAYLILSTTTDEVWDEGGAGSGGGGGGGGKESRAENGYAKIGTATTNGAAAGSEREGDDSLDRTITPSTSASASAVQVIQEIQEEIAASSAISQPRQSSSSLLGGGGKGPTTAQKHWLDAAKSSVEQGQVLLISKWERRLCWVLLVLSILMALVGTIWSFLPEF